MTTGILDLHVHCGPEAIPRRFDFLELARHLSEHGMAAVAKSHFHSTVPWAWMAAKAGYPTLYGSVTLNYPLGGINPDAVRASLGLVQERETKENLSPQKDMQGNPNGKDLPLLRIVWMPTLHAAGHIRMQQAHGQTYDIPAEWTGGVFSKGSQLLEDITPIDIRDVRWREPLREVLQLIAANDITLATGHLTREEVLELVPLASSLGVKKIILTHPAYHATSLTDEDLLQLTALPGVFAEQSYALMPVDGLTIGEIARMIRLVGPAHTILSTDLGQIGGLTPAEGMETYLQNLRENDIPDHWLHQMSVTNPAWLLGCRLSI